MNSGENQVHNELEENCLPSKLKYEPPGFRLSDLSAVVLSGPTGGGDSGETGLPDEGVNDEHGLDEEDFYFG